MFSLKLWELADHYIGSSGITSIDLANILALDELMIMNFLLKDVDIQVRYETEIGDKIQTNIGVPQCTCARTLVLVLYLAHVLKLN